MVKNEESERIRLILEDIGRGPIRSFGQNFLTDNGIASKIVKAIPEEYMNDIVEIGPGLGILTNEMLERGATIRSIEKDSQLADKLVEITPDKHLDRLEVIKGDATRLIPEMMKKGDRDMYVVSNLPFNISSRIMGAILDNSPFVELENSIFKGGMIMFQYEFARRLVSSSGNKNYGRISVMFSAKMEGDMKLKVPKGLFYPVPKVDAAVVGFGPKKQYLKKPVDVDVFNKLVHVVFLNRRKKLKNTVTPPSMGVDLEKEDILWILEDIGVRDLRPEELSPEVFIDLSDRISGLK